MTHHFAPIPLFSHSGQFYDQYLRHIRLNSDNIDWSQEDLDYLSSKSKYREFLWSKISSATRIAPSEIERQMSKQREYRIEYSGQGQLDGILRQFNSVVMSFGSLLDNLSRSPAVLLVLLRSPESLNMMTDHKAGIPRTSFEGVLSFTKPESGNRFWIVPADSKFIQPVLTP